MLTLLLQFMLTRAQHGCDAVRWTHIKAQGAPSGGQYQGSGPFGKGQCQDFSLPHCHHHGPVGNDQYPAEGAPGCPSQQSPRCARKCDAAATGKYDKFTFKGAVQTAVSLQNQTRVCTGTPSNSQPPHQPAYRDATSASSSSLPFGANPNHTSGPPTTSPCAVSLKPVWSHGYSADDHGRRSSGNRLHRVL